jgi:predicted dehydrogenase
MGLSTEVRKILICGLGSIGKRHLRVLRHHWKSLEIAILRSGHGPYVEEVQLADRVFTTLGDALRWKPGAAIICMPANKHLSTALPLARRGVPLLIEKPIGDGRESQHNWQELIHLSGKVPIEVGYVLRHDPCTAVVKSHLNEGIIGKPIDADFYCGSWLPDWRPGLDYRDSVSANRALGGGVLLELSHELDLGQYLFGHLELRSAILHQSGLLEIDVEDQAQLLAYSADQCLISIRLNFCTRPPSRHVHIRGRDGEIQWDLITSKVKVIQADASNVPCFQSPISSDDRYLVQMERFLSCAAGKAEPVCSVSDSLTVLDMVTQAREINTGHKV